MGLACTLALGGSYVGTTWYLDRPKGGQKARPAAVHREVSSTPETTPPATGDIVVHGTGDVLLDPSQLGALDSSFAAPWTGVRELFRGDAVTIVNLECSPGSGGTKQDKEFTFRCDDPGVLSAMHDGGVDVTNQANNHSGDFGRVAQMDGRNRLLRARLAPVGTGHNSREANEPAMFERNGKKIAVLGFGGVVPSNSWFATSDRAGEANGYSTASMVQTVRSAAARADLVFVAIHWGEELDTKPRDDDVARAHALIDAGADAIFGHHAHRLQPLQWYKGRPTFFGLGNFVWPKSGSTAIGEVVVSPEGTFKACLLPASLSYGRPALTGATRCS
jgi:hypothetical protein